MTPEIPGLLQAAEDSTPAWPRVAVLGVRPVQDAGNLRAYASIKVGGITIHACRVIQEPGKRPWASLPQVQHGGRWWPLVQVQDPRLRHLVCLAILGAWREHAGG